ncbi:MAG: rRNA methyltransferase [Deltaproteobacteria bacterium]|nr:rRNA methyltransferase [Deltaproteobacteria bacterium]
MPPPTRRRPPPGPPKRPPPHPKAQNLPELKVAGANACRALWTKRPDDVRRVYVTEEQVAAFADVLKECARRRIAYHVKASADLDQVAETVHHDGVLMLARLLPPKRPADVVAWATRTPGPAALVLLEDVKNPHNLGAILRVCAHFGVPFLLAAGDTPALSPAAMRTAEGGAEHCAVVPCGSGLELLETLRALGFSVVATSSHTDAALSHALPPRAVVLFGSEGAGLSRRLLERADLAVKIPGSGALESLNVACASSVVLWELWRRRG